jgi:hypothetical protein
MTYFSCGTLSPWVTVSSQVALISSVHTVTSWVTFRTTVWHQQNFYFKKLLLFKIQVFWDVMTCPRWLVPDGLKDHITFMFKGHPSRWRHHITSKVTSHSPSDTASHPTTWTISNTAIRTSNLTESSTLLTRVQ